MARYNHAKFTAADLVKADSVCTAGEYKVIGSYTVLAGEVIFPGFGGYDSMENAVGRIYALLKVAADTEVKGEYMLAVLSPQDIPLKILGNWRTEDWNTSVTDKTKQIPFPKMNIGASKDKKIVLYFKADATSTLDHTKCVMLMDITRVLLD